MNRRLLGSGVLLLLFLSPYLLLFSELGVSAQALFHGSFSWGDFWWALKNSIIQSGFSALGAMFLGVFIALGLNRLELQMPRALPYLQMVLLTPILLPPFFVILTFLSWMNPFPFGLIGIVLIHIFVLSGLTALFLRSLVNEKVGELSEVAEVLGAGRLQFFRTIWPLVRREFLSVFLFLFVWSFTSFSIPFVVGGGRGTTLEVLIFERVRISGDLAGAVMLSVFQTLLIAVLLYLQSRVEGVRRSRLVAGRLLQSRLGLGVAAAVAISFVLPWLLLSWSGFSFIFSTPGFLGSAAYALLQSIKFSVLVSLSVLTLLCVIVYLLEISWVAKFFQIYFPASMALVGLAGLSLAPYIDLRILYVAGLVLLFVPSLIKLGLDASYFALREQIEVARSLGARSWQIFMEILMPQLWPRICLLAGLSFVWTLGDFALAKFFFESGETLPLLIENLMSSYRIDPALSLGQFVLVAGAAGFFVFWRLGRVFDP